VDLFVVKATLEYHAPARYDDELDIGVRVGHIGNSSMQFVLGIFRGGEHLISGEVIYVAANSETRKSQTVRQALRKLVGQ